MNPHHGQCYQENLESHSNWDIQKWNGNSQRQATPPPPPAKNRTPPLAQVQVNAWQKQEVAGMEYSRQNLIDKHETIINQIIEEEENLIQYHKKHIDGMFKYTSHQLKEIEMVDQPNSDIYQYVD